jgi:hypothetical protein
VHPRPPDLGLADPRTVGRRGEHPRRPRRVPEDRGGRRARLHRLRRGARGRPVRGPRRTRGVRLKLDENLGHAAVLLFTAAGFDVATVFEQALTSATDDELYRACQAEGRVLVTLDLDFANPLRFDPAAGAGIAVMRVPSSPRRGDLEAVGRPGGTAAAGTHRRPTVGRQRSARAGVPPGVVSRRARGQIVATCPQPRRGCLSVAAICEHSARLRHGRRDEQMRLRSQRRCARGGS